MIFGSLDPRRFEALAGYARHPMITLITDEIGWFACPAERVLGIVVADRIDGDFGWVVFGRDETLRFRAIDVNTSHPTADDAHRALFTAMEKAAGEPDEAFHQGDSEKAPVDFFAPMISDERLHPSFRTLVSEDRFSPAREIISAMMRYHEDLDGRFVENFQAGGFDARLWELYLFATFNELGFVQASAKHVPDFILQSNLGALAIEATSANPPDDGPQPLPESPKDFKRYLENYIPIKIANALKSKLNRKPPYWDAPDLEDIPFCLAVQDFHADGMMRFIVPAVTEYVFGVRHIIENGGIKIERIKVHRYGKRKAQSGFFCLPGAENVSAVIVNPQGTLPKFNRIGFISGFGNPDVRMVRSGLQRNDGNLASPAPTPFRQEVDTTYSESWVEGMVVLHNPEARIPLDPNLIPGAAHEFLQDDGRIMSWLPNFHPFLSQTSISLGDRSNEKEG